MIFYFRARSLIPCRKSLPLLIVIQFGDHYIQVKDNGILDSGSLKGDRVRYIQVNFTVIYMARFSGSCSVTVIYMVTAIYRAVIYRFDYTLN